MNNYICYNRGGFLSFGTRHEKSNILSDKNVESIEDYRPKTLPNISNSKYAINRTVSNNCLDPYDQVDFNRVYLEHTYSPISRFDSSYPGPNFTFAPANSIVDEDDAFTKSTNFIPRLSYLAK